MFSKFFIERPRFAIVISIVIVLAGLMSLVSLPLEKYPMITPPQVTLSATYVGASADVIESTVAAPIEAAVNGVENMIYMNSTSSNGSYRLDIYFKVGSDPDMAIVNVQNKASLATPRLPSDVTRYGLTVKRSTGGSGIVIYGIYSPDNSVDLLTVSNYASIYLKDELARVPGVADVNIFGSRNYAIRVWLDAQKMATLRVSPAEVQQAISLQNTEIPSGSIGSEPLTIKQDVIMTLKTTGRLKTAEEFADIIVRSAPDGSSIRLKDIARVELDAEAYSFEGRSNLSSMTVIQITQLSDANAIQLAKDCHSKMAELSKKFPQGLKYKVIRDETEFIKESLTEVVKAIILAVFLVVMTVYMFLGDWRASIIPFVAIPVSLIGTMTFFSMFGFTINTLTLFAFVLAVGTVVDDAIVVVENVQRHIEAGLRPKEATIVSMEEVSGAIVAISLVLMAVFVPVAFISGIMGKMLQQFAVTIAVSIGISTVVALTLSPALCAIVLRPKEELPQRSFYEKYRELYRDYWAKNQPKNRKEKIQMTGEFLAFVWDVSLKKFNRLFDRIRDRFILGSKFYIERPVATVITLVALFISLLILFKITPTGFLPQEDSGVVLTSIQLLDGTSLSKTSDFSGKIEEEILKINGVEQVTGLVGINGENSSMLITGFKPWAERESVSRLAATFKPSEYQDKSLKGITTRLKEIWSSSYKEENDKSINGITGKIRNLSKGSINAKIATFSPPAISGLGMFGGFEYQLLDKGGRTPQELLIEANKLITTANQSPVLTGVFTQFNANNPQLLVKIDYAKAFAQGIPATEIQAALASQFGSAYINDFNKSGRVFRVMVQADEEYRSKISDMDKVYIKSQNGTMAPLSSVVTVEETIGPYSVSRFNMYPSVTINGNPAKGKSSGDAIKEMIRLSDEILPQDMGYAWSGTTYQELEASGQTVIVIILALIFVYLFLVALYESWVLPMSVILIAPIAIFGAVLFQYTWALIPLYSTLSVDIYAWIGFVMLVGLAAKQAILIVEFAKERHESGMSAYEAAIEAAKIRFRAVMMTSIAFILGILPLVFAKGPGSESRRSLGVIVFGGMLAAVVVGAILVPAFYALIQHACDKVEEYKKKKREEKKHHENE